MQENVGRIDRIVRSFVGPALAGLGYMQLRRGNLVLGAISIALGAVVAETAVTRVCPLNGMLGIDTRSEEERLRDSRAALLAETERVAVRYASVAATDESARLA